MTKARMEAFSDGVIAIIITIMVLEIHAPEEPALAALQGLGHVVLSYLMSFVFLGIYWSNHHHLLQAVREVNGRILWANLHLLFWLSLVPFVTSWMGATQFSPWPVALYGAVLICAAVAYFILVRALIRHHGAESTLAIAIGRDRKGLLSIAIYAVAIPVALAEPWISGLLYAVVSLIWLVPDRRIENVLGRSG